MLHGRIGLTCDRCLIDGGIAGDDAAIDDDLLTGMRGDDIAGFDLFDGYLALDLSIDEPYVALIEREQAGNMAARAFCRVARQHFRTVGNGKQRQARFRLAGQYRSDDSRRRQCISIGLMILDHALYAILDELAGNAEHEQDPDDLEAQEELRLRAAQDFHAGKAREREQGITAVLREAVSRFDGCLPDAFDRLDGQALDFPYRQASLIPDLNAPLRYRHGLDHAVAAYGCRQSCALFARQAGLQIKITTSVHYTVRHPLISDKAHQSICAPDGEACVIIILRRPRRPNSREARELMSNRPPVLCLIQAEKARAEPRMLRVTLPACDSSGSRSSVSALPLCPKI